MNTYKSFETLFSQLKLSPSAQKTYLACSSKGRLTSSEVTKQTKLPKPTVMASLKELQSVGLCQKTPLDDKSYYYKMLSPSHAKPYISHQITHLTQTLEELDSFTSFENEVVVKEAHTQTEIQEFLELALHCKERLWHIASPYKNAVRYMPKTYQEHFKNIREQRQIKSLSLWNKHLSKHSLKLHDQLMRKPRYVPSSQERSIEAMTIIFDEFVLIVVGKQQPSAVLISNPQVSETCKLLFEMAWTSLRKGSSTS